MTETTDALSSVRDLNAYQLARNAECADPDTLDSPGAKLLLGVRDDLIERLESEREDGQSWAQVFGDLDDEGQLGEIADAAPDVYTARMWNQFVDLAAYQEDISGYVTAEIQPSGKALLLIESLESAARMALYMIAERLVNALRELIVTAEREQDDDE